MIDLSCKYLGLDLKNPIIIGSSGLTSSIENLKTIDKMGAGAVVLKSIFEEQIRFEADKFIKTGNQEVKKWKDAFEGIVGQNEHYYEEALGYLNNYATEHTLNNYLSLITAAKQEISIPVIASINCSTRYDWQYFTRRIQEAGANALELNVYLLPSDFEKSGTDNEKVYFDIISEVKKHASIPISLKIGYYFSSLAQTALRLSESGIKGLTLFNRPYNPDINIDDIRPEAKNLFSSPSEYSHTLRWVALLSGKLKCDIAASTGIHDYESVIKQILAGADAVQMVSVFYKNHFDILPHIINGMEKWMNKHNFKSIGEFKGLLSSKNIQNPAAYERVQFLRLFSSVE